MGWISHCGSGKGDDAVTSGLEGAWTTDPVHFTTQYLDNLFGHEWVQDEESRAARRQWKPKDGPKTSCPTRKTRRRAHPLDDVHDRPLAEVRSQNTGKIAKRFHDDPEAFKLAFAQGLVQADAPGHGARARYLGAEVPKEDAGSGRTRRRAPDYKLIDGADVTALKSKILGSGLTDAELVRTAWASAASFRSTDKRGGANGARIRLAPRKGLGGQRSRRTCQGPGGAGRESRTASTRTAPTARKCRWPI